MHRRTALQLTVGACATALSGVAGCLDSDDDQSGWTYEVAGSVDARAAGRVFASEDFTDEGGDGGIAALDAATGEHEWTYGETRGYTMYTDPAVDDALYLGFGDDAIGSGNGEVIAVGFDGVERWTRSAGSVYNRPVLSDDAVFAGADDARIYRVARADGVVDWRSEESFVEEPGPPRVTAVGDAVYAGTGQLVALDTADGTIRWRFGDPDDGIRYPTVVDDVAYVGQADGVVAVEHGEELWRADDAGGVLAVTEGRVYAADRDGVTVLDAATGDELWSSTRLTHPIVDAAGTTYAAGTGGDLFAFDATDGTDRWRESFDAAVESIHVAAEAGAARLGADDHAVLVRTGDRDLHAVTPAGDVSWEYETDAGIRNVLVDDGVFVGTSEAIHGLLPSVE